MRTVPETSSPTPQALGPVVLPWRRGALAALSAALVNAAVWLVGRAGDVDFLVHPAGGEGTAEVSLAQVVLTSVLMVLLGWTALRIVARRSRSWVTTVLLVGAAAAVATTLGPLTTAVETSSGVLLAAMHLVTGAAFVVAAAPAQRTDP